MNIYHHICNSDTINLLVAIMVVWFSFNLLKPIATTVCDCVSLPNKVEL